MGPTYETQESWPSCQLKRTHAGAGETKTTICLERWMQRSKELVLATSLGILRRSQTVANGALPAYLAPRQDPGMSFKSLKSKWNYNIFDVQIYVRTIVNVLKMKLAVSRHNWQSAKRVFVNICYWAKLSDLNIL